MFWCLVGLGRKFKLEENEVSEFLLKVSNISPIRLREGGAGIKETSIKSKTE